ncbi:hypothetical protein JB92DRAFT_2838459 [Gautieria morchelliformis]|nr:hypothetical protein JB92DRAFT_2838459 [Gautieria morchelliformis]
MPRRNKKSTQAKQQRSTGGTHFISAAKDIGDDSSNDSSDESVGATKRLFLRKLPIHLRNQLATGKRERPVVYRKDSEQTHFRCQKYWKEASQGSADIGSFFMPKPLHLMPKSQLHVNIEDVTLQPDPVEEMAVDLGLDILDFCIDQLEDEHAMIMSDMEVDENEFEEIIAEIDADHSVTDSETFRWTDEAAHEWLKIDYEDVPTPTDIITIVKRCLQDVKKLKCGRTVKMMTQLTAVSEYVKLRDRYQAHGRSKKPCLKASLAIAHRMGKGFYFTRQVHQNEVYLLQHQQLPPSKANVKHGQYTLLDNENTTGHLKLSEEQLKAQASLPEDQHLKVTNSTKIIYLGKNHDEWWDLSQVMEQMKHAIDIFEHLHPDKVAIWLFDCSSAHEGLAKDTLSINNMGVRPGGKQSHL